MDIFLTILFWVIGVYLFIGLCVTGWIRLLSLCLIDKIFSFRQNWKKYLAIILIWPYVLKNLTK